MHMKSEEQIKYCTLWVEITITLVEIKGKLKVKTGKELSSFVLLSVTALKN